MVVSKVKVSGVVEKAELVQQAPYMPYYGNNERYDMKLDVALRLDDGSAVYFKAGAGRLNIASAPGCTVVMYFVDGHAKDWAVEVGDKQVAVPGESNDNRLEPLVKAGDRITVEGRLKAEEVSCKGNACKVLTHVRMVKE